MFLLLVHSFGDQLAIYYMTIYTLCRALYICMCVCVRVCVCVCVCVSVCVLQLVAVIRLVKAADHWSAISSICKISVRLAV